MMRWRQRSSAYAPSGCCVAGFPPSGYRTRGAWPCIRTRLTYWRSMTPGHGGLWLDGGASEQVRVVAYDPVHPGVPGATGVPGVVRDVGGNRSVQPLLEECGVFNFRMA